jgi:antibiotic biosynthesis monooxygenase (ABM) superfamily enzyme
MPQKSLSDNKELAILQDIVSEGLHNGKSRQEIFDALKENYTDKKTLAGIVAKTPNKAQIKANVPWRNLMMTLISLLAIGAVLYNLLVFKHHTQIIKATSIILIITVCSADISGYYLQAKRKLFHMPVIVFFSPLLFNPT